HSRRFQSKFVAGVFQSAYREDVQSRGIPYLMREQKYAQDDNQ
ncbi:hypothetical protein VC116063_002137B, partial [Vibrio cholerae O1 str. 116063]